MDWTLTYKVDDIEAAQDVVGAATKAQEAIADDPTAKAAFVASFNKAFTDAGAVNPAGANGLSANDLVVTKEVTFSVQSSKPDAKPITDLAALEAAVEAAKPTTETKAETKAAEPDATTAAAADETSGAFEKTAIATVFMAFASVAIF